MCCTSSMYVQLAEHWFVLLFVNPGTGVCMHRYSSTLAFADYMCALPPPPPPLHAVLPMQMAMPMALPPAPGTHKASAYVGCLATSMGKGRYGGPHPACGPSERTACRL